MNRNKVSGHIRPRPNKKDVRYYEAVLELGRDKLTGERNRLTFRSDSPDKDVAEQLLLIKKSEYLQQKIILPSNMTVGEYMKEYLDTYVKPIHSPATTRDYRNTVDHYIVPAFGKIKLQNLNQTHIQKAFNQWAIKSPTGKKGLSCHSLEHINRVLKASLNNAIELGYISKNPAKKIKISKDMSTELEVYSSDEIIHLRECVKGTDMELIVALLFDCVLRRGELLGLKFSDIDFENRTVHINKSLVVADKGDGAVLKDCKTKKSNRKIEVTESTMNLLKRQHVRYKEKRLNQGSAFHDDGFVICQYDGKPFAPASMTQKWRRTLEKYGLRHIKLHGTRHSAVSYLMAIGIPTHIVQQRAGHSTSKITLDVYGHVSADTSSLVAEKLQEGILAT